MTRLEIIQAKIRELKAFRDYLLSLKVSNELNKDSMVLKLNK